MPVPNDNEIDSTEPEPSDLRDDVAAAFEEAAAPEAPEAPAAEAAPEAAPVEETDEAGQPRDPKGRFATKDPEGAAPVPAPPAAPPAPAQAAAPTPAVRAPQSWRPEVREKFASLPPEVQAEVARRERDVDLALKESVGARRAIEELQRIVTPFRDVIAAEGSTPAQGFQQYLNTVATLHRGSPAQKADAIAQAVQRYGVDIEALAAALDRQPQGAPPAAQPYRDPRVDDLLGRIQQAESARLEQIRSTEEQAVQDFAAKHEYFEDVRQDMADLMDVAARRGLVLSYEDAYNRAVAARPEIAQLLRQREAVKAARTGAPAIARAKTAASSIKSKPVAAVPTKARDTDDLRAAIEEAVEEAEQRR